jgi:putative aldouronate transport system substrate-binding protein
VFFKPDELKKLNLIESDIKQFVNLKRAQWLSKGGIAGEWDAYVAQLDSMGLKDLIAIYQAALDRYRAAQ